MRRRHPVPKLWLMTDERLGESLWPTLEALPRGAGVIFRDYSLAPGERRARFARALAIARRRRLILLRAGGVAMRGEMGTHNVPGRCGRQELQTRAVHSRRERIAAERAGVDAILISPVFPTRSHPGSPVLGAVRMGLMLNGTAVPAIALGGMNIARFRRLRGLGVWGWAAIDALAVDQKRKAVPT